jgi:hypothetical protein
VLNQRSNMKEIYLLTLKSSLIDCWVIDTRPRAPEAVHCPSIIEALAGNELRWTTHLASGHCAARVLRWAQTPTRFSWLELRHCWYVCTPLRRRGKLLRVQNPGKEDPLGVEPKNPHASATLRPLRTTKRLGQVDNSYLFLLVVFIGWF